MVRVFTNGPGDLDSIKGRAIPKTQKILLDASFTITQHHKVRVKWGNTGKGVAPSPISWRSSYRKLSLRITLDYYVLYFSLKL